jgi:hypothetical protein
MPKRRYNTIADELLEIASQVENYFQHRGYNLHIEKTELGFPYTPALLCKRMRTSIIVEIDANLQLDRIGAWVGYARSSGKDTRLAVCLPLGKNISPEEDKNLRDQGIGLYLIGNNEVVERIPPNDLALSVQLPGLSSLPPKVRKLLGASYEQFSRSQWREGFEDACQAFESEARRYLKLGIKRNRIKIMTKKGIKNLTPKKIDGMTIGQLAIAFSQIQSQNHADAIIGQTLKKINKDRIGVAHHKAKVKTEKRLRVNVGQHMWTLVAAMKELI